MRLLLAFLSLPWIMSAYSVLTHEALIDAAWKDSIQPLLLRRFPSLTAEELRKAHAYAYGGAIVHDMGYYPFGSSFFSDLLHYVRAGDFVEALWSDAKDANEAAFAAGALAHFVADDSGHSVAVNRSVALTYPKLARRYGDIVTYQDDPAAHVKVEFGFDVSQVAKARYVPEAYRDFIGFSVAKELLERAFLRTYGIELGDVLPNVNLSIGTFRFSVSNVIPAMTKAAWAAKKDEIVKAQPGITRQRFLYNLSRASYRAEWGSEYKGPGFFARFIAFVFRALPKVGPLRALGFRPPAAEAEALFMRSFNEALRLYRDRTAGLLKAGKLELADENLDTGKPARNGEYALADKTCLKLVRKLSESGSISAELRAKLAAYFAGAPQIPAELR